MNVPSRLVAGALLLAAPLAFAQTSANATASANIVARISIANTAALQFGDIVAGTSGTNIVTVAPNGTRAISGAGNASLAGGTITAASFTVSGSGSKTYAITLPATAATLTGPSSSSMTVDTFTSVPSGTGTLSSGSQVLAVGANLNLSANQTAGNYTGTFTVTVAYN